MQVNRIQTNTYTKSFGRLDTLGTRFCPPTKMSSDRLKDIVRDCHKENNRVEKLAKKIMNKCNETELKELAEELSRKISRKSDVSNPSFI